MSIIGIQICTTDSTFTTGNWIKNEKVKASLAFHNVEVQISNSLCDSGNMTTAGVILLKHPSFTHRMDFLLIRRKLHIYTLYWHRSTQKDAQRNWMSSPSCEMWSKSAQSSDRDTLWIHWWKTNNGTLYWHQLLASMTQEATEDIFDIHQKNVQFNSKITLVPTNCQYRQNPCRIA
jgi:hypothetical protein